MAKDCLVSYRGNRYSVPHEYAGRSVLVREPLDSGTIRVFDRQQLIAEHRLATGKGAMVVQPSHYGNPPRRARLPIAPAVTVLAELAPGPGVGLHYAIPEVELRPLSIYNSFCETGDPGDGFSSLGWKEVAHVAAV